MIASSPSIAQLTSEMIPGVGIADGFSGMCGECFCDATLVMARVSMSTAHCRECCADARLRHVEAVAAIVEAGCHL
eukprot:3400662-Amphidinium_carterae.1